MASTIDTSTTSQTTASARRAGQRPAPQRPDDDRFVPLAAELGAQFAERAAEHDRENTFVAENVARLRESGYTSIGIPTELGGLGASLRQICYAQAELARYCGSTALAINMHIHPTLAHVYRWKHGAEDAANLLRRLSSERLLLMSSGGSDGIWPSATATRIDGGFRVNGRKTFCSLAPGANLMSTLAAYDDPEQGRVILGLGIPTTSEGVQVIETWDTLGMRGTASHDVQLDDVFVADAQVGTRMPWGRVGPVLRVALPLGMTTIAAVYYGIAAGARDEAVRVVMGRHEGDGTPRTQDTNVIRLVGLMEYKLRTAWWALLGVLSELGNHYQYEPTEANVNTVMLAKRCVVTEAIEVVNLAMETVGGAAYFRRSPLERAYRDVRAGTFHVLTPEKTLQYAGRLALGQPVDQIW
jgi:alkylation response protein AidB-like acyl-CoA dehydrogenase